MSASATAAPKAATASAAVEAARSPASANAGSQVKTTSRLTAPSLGSNRSGTNSLGQSRARSESASGKSVRSRRRDHGLGAKPTGRMLSQARRAAQSGRGKAATNAPTSAAGLARQANPKLSGRELSQRVRAQRSHNGGAGEPKSAPTGRLRPNAAARGAADQHWKVGVSETAAGQTVTGTRVGRSPKTTGDESSTCRAVTGTEYMGADIFREFCHTEPRRGVLKVGVSPSGQGNSITGNEVGRSTRVTGDEPGSCTRVTGTDYLSPAHFEAFCETTPEPNHGRRTGLAATQGGQPVSGSQVGRSTRVTGDEQGAGVQTTGTQYTNVQSITDGIPPHQSGNRPAAQVPKKVGVSSTLSGRQVTGTRVGRAAQVTGDEPGSCRSVTGDEYLSSEQYESFCATRPEPEPARAGEESRTALGQRVSGTQTGRSTRVTGDEPGTCKAVTGTPYAGMEQMAEYCSPAARESARERMMPMARRSAGAAMTGQAPGVGGKISGDERGVCEPLTGTPYVSPAQQSAVCAENESFQADQSGLAATPDEADFPQPLSGASWPSFSVTSPARQADHQRAVRASAVTGGLDSKNGGRITGPFGMATGKITGTEEARFGAGRKSAPASASAPAGEPAPSGGRQVTGEGLSAGLRITGDDWARGERVTGTEGAWSKQRNPTRSGPTSAMPSFERKRNEETPLPVSRVTGSSGNTERGSLITYSGGARG
ncbi:CsoS2 family carboxysome shell protein [Rhabdochromatium marinum]|uniref:CsoS2 family carboxysome shell protein n=1 Tax=Rhabdochromatium marinum TaxID=48729 RepID=UPI001F5C03BF|nr:CsoS2 family carboxysome shell protein [Rhabdochromatium marinum]